MKCGSCGNVWHATRDDAVADTASPAVTPAPEPATETPAEPAIAMPPPASDDTPPAPRLSADPLDEEEIDIFDEPDTAVAPERDDAERPARRRQQSKSAGKGRKKAAAEGKGKRRRRWPARLAWMLFLLLAVLVVGGAWWFKPQIIAKYPAAEELYEAVDIFKPPLGDGLELRNVRRLETAPGPNILMVEGEIANISDGVRDVPALRGEIYDNANRLLQSWTFQAPERKLLPGETVTFRSELRNPATNGERLTIVFHEGK